MALTTVHYRGKMTGVLVIEIPLTHEALAARNALGYKDGSLFVLVLPGSLCSLTTHSSLTDAFNALQFLENEAEADGLARKVPGMLARWLSKRGWDNIDTLPEQNELEKAAFAELHGGYDPSLGVEVAPQAPNPDIAPAGEHKLD